MEGATEHPAKFSAPILGEVRRLLGKYVPAGATLLDPFAGVGGIHQLNPEYTTVGVELEPEWAKQSPHTIVGNALELDQLFANDFFDAVVTSPCYGNRMADHHNARDTSKRYTYRHMLGRMPTEGSSAVMQWGPAYKRFHNLAWLQVWDVLKPGGIFILNSSDHVRGGQMQQVSLWHKRACTAIGFELLEWTSVRTQRMRNGANARLRVDHEDVLAFRKTV